IVPGSWQRGGHGQFSFGSDARRPVCPARSFVSLRLRLEPASKGRTVTAKLLPTPSRRIGASLSHTFFDIVNVANTRRDQLGRASWNDAVAIVTEWAHDHPEDDVVLIADKGFSRYLRNAAPSDSAAYERALRSSRVRLGSLNREVPLWEAAPGVEADEYLLY